MSNLPHFVLDDPVFATAVIAMNFIKTMLGRKCISLNATGTSFKTILNSSSNLASSRTISSGHSSLIHSPPRFDQISDDSGNYDRAVVSKYTNDEKCFDDEVSTPSLDEIENYSEQGRFFFDVNTLGFTPATLSDDCWTKVMDIVAKADMEPPLTHDNSYDLIYSDFMRSENVGGNISHVYFEYADFQPNLNSTPSRF